MAAMTDSQRWMVLAVLGLAGVLLYLLAPVLTPFLISALLAYLCDPLVDRLEAMKIPRTLAVLTVFIVVVLVVLTLLLLLVPRVSKRKDASTKERSCRDSLGSCLPSVSTRLLDMG